MKTMAGVPGYLRAQGYPKTAEAIEEGIAENARLRATLDAAIRVLSDDRLSLQSRVNDTRATLSR